MIILVYGLPGMGKTTLMHDLVRVHVNHRFFVVDHTGEWGPEALHWRGKPPKKIEIIDDVKSIPSSFDEEGVFVFQNMDSSVVAEQTAMHGDTTYVDDEIDMVAIPEGWKTNPLRHIVHRGRHLKNAEGEVTTAHILGACRRPQNLVRDITDIADQVYIFRVQGDRTLERLKRDSMIEGDEWEKIRTLPVFHFKYWSGQTQQYLSIPPIGGGGDEASRFAHSESAPSEPLRGGT